MRLIITILFLIITIRVNAQKAILRVLGKVKYTISAESNGMTLSFKKNEIKKTKRLIDTIAFIGITNKLVLFNNPKKKHIKSYTIEVKSEHLFDKLIKICNKLEIKIDHIYYILPKHKFENEDENAILALANANYQAQITANHLNYKVVKILNIDDETTYSNPIYDGMDMDNERTKMVMRILTILGGTETSSYSSEPIRDNEYSIWVTYQLVKK